MPRPKIEIDISRVEEYAAQGLSQAEICLCLGISEDTLSRRKADSAAIADAIKSGKAKAASEISNTLYQMARGKDLGAIIWYEKTRRGLSDKTTTVVAQEIDYILDRLRDSLSPDEYARALAAIRGGDSSQ
jgi:transcriptional regulator with XRE-family HTH domain